VLENSEGGTGGTLLAALNNCVTPVGRRRLRQWLCRPLFRIPDIEARQASKIWFWLQGVAGWASPACPAVMGTRFCIATSPPKCTFLTFQ